MELTDVPLTSTDESFEYPVFWKEIIGGLKSKIATSPFGGYRTGAGFEILIQNTSCHIKKST